MGISKAGKTFENFSQETSCHGFNHLESDQKKYKKFFWFLLIIVALGFCCFQLYLLVVEFQNGDVVVSLVLSDEPFAFPAVTVCNLNPFHRDKLKDNPRLKLIDDLYQELLWVPDSTPKTRETGQCIFFQGYKFADPKNVWDQGKGVADNIDPKKPNFTDCCDACKNNTNCSVAFFQQEGCNLFSYMDDNVTAENRSTTIPKVYSALSTFPGCIENGSCPINGVQKYSCRNRDATDTQFCEDKLNPEAEALPTTPSPSFYDKERLAEDENYLRNQLNESGVFDTRDLIVAATFLHDAISFIAQDLDPELLERTSAQLDELVLNCSFGGEPCVREEWKQFFDMQYGNCYIFNWNGDRVVTRAGRNAGLFLRLLAQRARYMEISHSVGLRVVIKAPGEFPIPSNDGFNVATAFENHISLRFTELQYYNQKRRPCSPVKNDTWFAYEGDYSLEPCFQMCHQEALGEWNGCTDAKKPRLKTRQNISHCGLQKKDKMEEFSGRSEAWDNEFCSSCHVKCGTDIFDRTLSQSIWADDLEFEVCRNGNNSEDCNEKIKADTAGLFIYFQQFPHIVYKESLLLDLENVVSKFGGNLGIALGVSVLTLVEFFLLGLQLFKACCSK